MPRGGARKNAGRKPKLDGMERYSVGARCQHLWREAYNAAAEALSAEENRLVRQQWAKFRAVEKRLKEDLDN